MQTPRNFKLRWLAATLVVAVVLLSTVASHGCEVKGSSPVQSPSDSAAPP